MQFYYSSRRASPLVFLVFALILVLLLPIVGGFFLLITASTLLGWIVLKARRSLLGSQKTTAEKIQEAKVVVMDRDDNVITIQE